MKDAQPEADKPTRQPRAIMLDVMITRRYAKSLRTVLSCQWDLARVRICNPAGDTVRLGGTKS
jgi:hypothetical protein